MSEPESPDILLRGLVPEMQSQMVDLGKHKGAMPSTDADDTDDPIAAILDEARQGRSDDVTIASGVLDKLNDSANSLNETVVRLSLEPTAVYNAEELEEEAKRLEVGLDTVETMFTSTTSPTSSSSTR